MNVALIALANDEIPVTPPLTLAYIAAVLEHQRHIVRIYDLALTSERSLTRALEPLRRFHPQVVIVVGEEIARLEAAVQVLRSQNSNIVPMQLERDKLAQGQACAAILAWFEQQSKYDNFFTHSYSNPDLPLKADLDRLPLPARHLLALEDYGLRAVGHELQTTVLLGLQSDTDPIELTLRSPSQIVTELRSVSREYGIRHYLFPAVSLTIDRAWLHEFLTRLTDANLRVSWEGSVDALQLDESLLAHMARSGCEKLRFCFNTNEVFESAALRSQVRQMVALAHQFHISVLGEFELDSTFKAIPHLVDVTATFGLDDATFTIRADTEVAQTESEAARKRYQVSRLRQQLIDQFGFAIGTLLWLLHNSRIGVVLRDERGMDLEEPSDVPV